MNTNDFLDAIRLKHAVSSDYMVSKLMGTTTQNVSHWRSGERRMGDDACMKVAELLEIKPEYVLACIAAERAKSDGVRAAWERAAVALAAGLMLGIGVPSPAEAAAGTAGAAGPLYIMSTRRHPWNRRDRRRYRPFDVCARTTPLPLIAA